MMNSARANNNPQSTIGNPQLIRVVLVDDSPVALAVLRKMIAASPSIEVVGTARHGKEALEIIPRLKPDVVCLDLNMPVMDGMELTREIMARFPCPILVVSSTIRPDEREKAFPFLQAGALDVFPKPTNILAADTHTTEQFISKIRLLAGVPVFTRHKRAMEKAPSLENVTPAASAAPVAADATGSSFRSSEIRRSGQRAVRIVAIGASTGGPQTLQTIFSKLPSSFPVPILCVQHISEGFLQGLVDWLSTQCSLKIAVARSGEIAQPGTIYFPVEGTHLEINEQGRLMASRKLPVGGHRPSVTTTFKAVADYYSDAALAVLLTGMGRDGAEGMQAVSQAGGITIAQDEATSVVFGMPKQAIDLGAVRYVLPVNEIAPTLLNFVGDGRGR